MVAAAQFADDTTLVLDGSHSSLKAALNILEIFGSYSGLKMNTSKTKVIWIGRKKYSKDKLDLAHRKTDANCIHSKDNAPKPLGPTISNL